MMSEAKKNTGFSAARELLARTFDHAQDYLDALPARSPFPSEQALD